MQTADKAGTPTLKNEIYEWLLKAYLHFSELVCNLQI